MIKDFVKKGFGKPLSSSGSKIEIVEVEDFLNQSYDFRLNDVTSKPEYESSTDALTTTEIAKILAENNLSFRISSASLKKIGRH